MEIIVYLTKTPRNQKGFTLIELMVVVSILSLMASILLVDVADARRAARDAVVIANVQTLVTALQQFEADNGSYPSVLNESAISSPGFEQCLDSASCGSLYSLSQLVTGASSYLNQIPAPPPGVSFGFSYLHRVTGKSSSAQVLNTCFLGSACGFISPTMTLTTCIQDNGDLPADTSVKAALFFNLENGPSRNYKPSGAAASVWGSNVVCLY